MDISDSNMGPKKIVTWDIAFLDSTGDKWNVKRKRHAPLSFLKIDMRHQDPLPRLHIKQDAVEVVKKVSRSFSKHKI